ncbi:MAG: hypothetical protein EVA29_02260 [Candidatus Actinomarinales bacterium]|nr:MAG: hypothetical protein EVA29_02260 [Candidatus Actinomarinales bacterium]
MDEINILNNQLSRIRAMNRYYHNQFLVDLRIFFITTCIFYYLGFTNSNVYAVIPIISLFGSVILSFHAHYLIFSRNFSQFIEEKINKISGSQILIAHKLENNYFFPINDRKIVVASIGKNFSWFGFVTLFITFFGLSSYFYSIFRLTIDGFNSNYILFILFITLITLITGIWWFLLGYGEKRLEKVFDEYR